MNPVERGCVAGHISKRCGATGSHRPAGVGFLALAPGAKALPRSRPAKEFQPRETKESFFLERLGEGHCFGVVDVQHLDGGAAHASLSDQRGGWKTQVQNGSGSFEDKRDGRKKAQKAQKP